MIYLSIFIQLAISDVIDKHIPFLKLSRKQLKHKKKPWITIGIMAAIREKNI